MKHEDGIIVKCISCNEVVNIFLKFFSHDVDLVV